MFLEGISVLFHCICLILRVSGSSAFPPPLQPHEEREYFIKCRNGDLKARNTLIERNLRLVAHIAKKYYSQNHDNDDLISIGTIGLIKAIDSYDIDNGARFATYAGKCLQNEILMYFRSQKKTSSEISLSEAVEIDKDGNPLTYMDIICCEDTIVDQIDLKMKTSKMIKGINTVLNDRERQIIILRYGLGYTKPITQREVAEKLKISRSYVSRIEKSALSKLSELF